MSVVVSEENLQHCDVKGDAYAICSVLLPRQLIGSQGELMRLMSIVLEPYLQQHKSNLDSKKWVGAYLTSLRTSLRSPPPTARTSTDMGKGNRGSGATAVKRKQSDAAIDSSSAEKRQVRHLVLLFIRFARLSLAFCSLSARFCLLCSALARSVCKIHDYYFAFLLLLRPA